MPVEEIVGFGFRVGVDVAIDVVQAVGSGDTRTAAKVRCATFAAGAVYCALMLWVAVGEAITGDVGLLSFSWLVLLMVGGGYFVWRVSDEVRRLRHWGEPVVMASAAGLIIAKTGQTIAWDDIVSVEARRRAKSGQVRVHLAGMNRRKVTIASRKPEAFAAAILAHPALERLSK